MSSSGKLVAVGPPAIGTIYVQKWLIGDTPPRNLTVTISESGAEQG